MTFASANCRSLNSSSPLNLTLAKINFLLQLKHDIYFLSELKLSSPNRLTQIKTHLLMNKFGPYDIYCNSSSGSRGVAILIKKTTNLIIKEQVLDPNENFLILHAQRSNYAITLCSVYAPCNQQISFLDNLFSSLSKSNAPLVIGGDFNLSPSHAPPHLNPDLESHQGGFLPASSHLHHLMDRLNLTDIFRDLNPVKREFSFRRHSKHGISKSRIDFFLISTSLKRYATDSTYILTPSIFFDHSTVSLKFSTPTPKHDHQIYVSHTAASSTEIARLSKLALTHLISDYSLEPPRDTITDLLDLNQQIFSLQTYLIHNHDLLIDTILQHKIDMFNSKYETLNTNQVLTTDNFNVQPPELLQLYLNDVKMSASKFSKTHTITKREEASRLASRLNEEKSNPDYNLELINSLEHKLNVLINSQAGALRKFTTQDLIEMSQGCPKAISNCLNAKKQDSLSIISKPDGSPFENEQQRGNHIYNFYSNIYSQQATTLPIQHFINHITPTTPPTINQNTFQPLLTPITPKEILETANSLSACTATGLDGINNTMLKNIIPTALPLFTLAFNHILAGNGSFPNNMKIAKLKLIPKKQKSSSINDWRPISILGSTFKLFSKIIAHRLGNILPQIINLEQKAYVKNANIAEVTANLIETITSNQANPNPTFLLSIDLCKAFDSLAHESIPQILNFFSFPPPFIKVISNWLQGRQACIQLDSSRTNFFDISQGIPQGDPLSGYIFILAIEILILKQKSIPSLKPSCLLPLNTPPLTCEAYADDLISPIPATHHALATMCSILDSYSSCTNLTMNRQKSEIIILGKHSPETTNIANACGFRVVDQIHHLGITIDKNCSNLHLNWETKIRKLNSLVNTLSQLHLPLPSKINIAKTFLYSQFTYIAATIPYVDSQAAEIEHTIMRFLFPRKHHFSKARVFSHRTVGGLGLPPIREFIDSIRTRFALRSSLSWQPWALAIRKCYHSNDITRSQTVFPNPPANSQLNIWIKAINNFQNCYWHKYPWSAPLFQSPVNIDPLNNSPNIKIPNHLANTQLANATLCELFDFGNKNVKTAYSLGIKFNTFLNPTMYLRLYSLVRHNTHNLPKPASPPPPKSISFLLKKKPQTKLIREIIHPPPDANNFNKLQPVILHHSLLPLPHPPNCINKNIAFLNIWAKSFLPIELSCFALSFLNRKQIFNAQKSKYTEHHRSCSFCIHFPSTSHFPDETFDHFYLFCPTSKAIANAYFPTLLTVPINVIEIIALGAQSCNNLALAINIEVILFCHYLFQCKTQKKIPTVTSFLQHTFHYKKILLNKSKIYSRAYDLLCMKHGARIIDLNKWLLFV